MAKFTYLSDLNEKEKKEYLEKVQKQENSYKEELIEKPKIQKETTKDTVNLPLQKNKIQLNNMLGPQKAQTSGINRGLPIQTKSIKETATAIDENNKKKKNSILSKLGFVGKSTGAGLLSGITGLGQAVLTDLANQADKGKEKSAVEITKNIINNLGGPSQGTAITNNFIQKLPSLIKNTKEIISDKDKSVSEKVAEILTNSTSEATNMIPGKELFNTGFNILGKANPNTSNQILEMNDVISRPSKELNEELSRESQNYGKATQFLGTTGQVIGNMLPSIATTAITKNPTIGLGTMGISAKGQATQEALDKGADLDRAVKIGDTKAMIEVGTEMLSGGLNIFGKGALDDIVERGIDRKVKNQVLNFLTKQGAGLAGEIGEETISDILGTVIDKGTVDPNAKYSLKDWSDTALTTMLSTVVLNALGGGYTPTAYKQNIENMQKNNQQMLPTSQTQENNNESNLNIKSDEEQIKNDSNNFTKQIEALKNGTFPKNDMLKVGNTPKILKELGLPDLPITITQKHLYTIMNESGKYKNVNYHGLGEDIVKQLPEAINNPLDIVKSNTRDDSIVLTTYLADKNNNPVIASIKVDGKGRINDIIIDSNVVTSAYGRNNYDKFMQDNIKNGNLLYDIDRGIIKKIAEARLQLPSVSNSTIDDRLQSPINDSNIINNSITFPKENVNTTNYSMQNAESNTQNEVSFNLLIDKNTKMRKHYRSVIQSQYTSDETKAISRELMKSDTYVPESNARELERADKRIEMSGADNELSSLMSRSMTGGNIKADDIAVGERLIQYYSKTGNKAKLQEAIQATAMAGTTAGQTVQAMSLLNHQTPEGQAIWLQRSVDKMNNDLKRNRGDNAEQFNLTEDMIDKIVNSKNQKELYKNLDDVYAELGQQVSKTNAQKVDAWRYFSMLANPRTHIRNIVGNVFMGKIQSAKNIVAGGIEDVVSKFKTDMERTKTALYSADAETKQFAKKDIENVADRLGLNENKYNPKSRLENSMRTFKSDVLENTVGKAFSLNDNLLEAEDGIGLKSAYVKAFSNYVVANDIDINEITDTQLAKARNYAVEQAKEATFHQDSNLATLINQLSNKNKFSKFVLDAVLPFKKTPINVAKSGIEYSPVGLVKNATYDIAKLRKGEITVNQYIDNVSKGLTGTGIALVGYALAKAGIIKASGSDDDKKEQYDENQGKQTYSIKIGNNTYSLDWLAPSGIPLFIGAEIWEASSEKVREKTTLSSDDNSNYNKVLDASLNILNSMTNSMNPMAEMSMLSGLTSALQSYEQDSAQMFASIGTNALKSYVNQFFPTAMGQVAKTLDDYERTTTSTKSGVLPKAIDSTKNQIMSKIPGLRNKLPTKTDVWGNDVKQSDNIALRGLENAVFPWTRKNINTTKVDSALEDLYDTTGESSVLPTSIDKTMTIDKQKYRLTDEEYAKYKKSYGEISYNLINKLTTLSDYKKLTSEQKQKAIENIYSYAKESNKADYAKQNKLSIETSTLYNTMEDLRKNGGNQAEYLEYISRTADLDKNKDKINVLSNSKYTNKTKEIIYQNTLGKEDKTYQIVKKTGIEIDSYLEYKSNAGDTKASVSNSLKNTNNISENQKLLIIGLKYSLENSEKKQLAHYINSLNIRKTEKIEIYSKLKGFTVNDNGTINW